MKDRVLTFDLMRTLAIFIILFHHLPYYTFNFYNLENFGISFNLSPLNELNRYFGLGLFIFISGYLLNLKDIRFPNWDSAKNFLYKKIIRLFPLYYIAIPLFCYMYRIDDPLKIVVQIFGLQSLLHSGKISSFPTLWFIGTIFIYYFIFVILKINKINRISKALITVGFLLFTLVSTRYFGVVDFRVSLYYIPFLFGVYCAKTDFLGQGIFRKLSGQLFLGVLFAFVAFYSFKQQDNFSQLRLSAQFALVNVLVLSFVIFVYSVFTSLASKIESSKVVELIAYCSYGMFLFHRPVWFTMKSITGDILQIKNPYITTPLFILLGIPIIIGVSYYIQQSYDQYCFHYLLNKRFLPWRTK